MYGLIRENQLDIMLFLCGACASIAVLLLMTRFLSESRKRILLLMELMAILLLWSDRQAYIWAGQPGYTAYVMVRLSNFLVFFMTSAVVLGFNLYLRDWMLNEGGMTKPPLRLLLVHCIALTGMAVSIISAFTGLYYYFDENNLYQRGHGFLIAYIFPVLGPLIQYTLIRQYKRVFSRLVYISLVLYLFVPIVCGILQIFYYGISIVNMSMVLVSISLYLFTYLDINDTVEWVHKVELKHMREENSSARTLAEQISGAYAGMLEKQEQLSSGSILRTAGYARMMAEAAGKSERECDEIYFAALLYRAGEEQLAEVKEYPGILTAARCGFEEYDGSGTPEHLEKDAIPEIARIIAVARHYDELTSSTPKRGPFPRFIVREEFIKEAGIQYDPRFSAIMVSLIEGDGEYTLQEGGGKLTLKEREKSLECGPYRETVSLGILLEENITRVRFHCAERSDAPGGFSAPSLILFDSYDRIVHRDEEMIKAFGYTEFGELWFDGRFVSTHARSMEVSTETDRERGVFGSESREHAAEILCARFEDHIRLRIRYKGLVTETVAALPDSSRYAYIGLTGEYCRLNGIEVEQTGERVQEGDIPRIAEKNTYLNRMEGDFPNLQIDGLRTKTTRGILLEEQLKLAFHSMSLPSAILVRHCPYVVLFSSENGEAEGEGYREYALIRLNGETLKTSLDAVNQIEVTKHSDHQNWDSWLAANKQGTECRLEAFRRGDRIIIRAFDEGIELVNTTTFREVPGKLYIALTGERCALTDIRLL